MHQLLGLEHQLLSEEDEDEDEEEGEEEEEDPVILEEMEADDTDLADDDGHAAFNKAVTLTLREKAIAEMEEKGIEITPEEAEEALAILPKVSFY